MPLDLNGNKLFSTSIGPKGEVIRQISTDGLVLHLDVGNKNSYGGSGTTWTDLSGNGNNSTLVNGPSYSSDNGGAFLFDGTNDYTTFSTSQLSPGAGAFTWNWWVKLNNLSNFSILFSGTGSNTGYGVVYLNPTSGGLGYYATGNRILDNNTSFGTNWWYITFTGNGGANGSRNLKLYRNAVQAGSTYTADYSFSSSTPNIGANHDSYAELMRGYIATATYYNRVLSESEISQNYNIQKGRFGL
jgi:hypothetical protein